MTKSKAYMEFLINHECTRKFITPRSLTYILGEVLDTATVDPTEKIA
jgi:hypothetical protein